MDQMGKTTKNDIKIIVVGNSGTGKTSFVNKWIKDTFDETYKATIVSEFSFKVVDYKDKSYKIQLWDLAGMDQNICITKIFSKDSHGCIVVSVVAAGIVRFLLGRVGNGHDRIRILGARQQRQEADKDRTEHTTSNSR